MQILAVWFILLAFSFCRAPVPAINEPHYLTKARHYVQPDWCDADLFISSSDAHVVFFWLIGPIAKHSMLAAAIVGRVVGYLSLAIGWVLLVTELVNGRRIAVVSCVLFLMLAVIGNFSGEWIVGGIESKIPAYGFVFASLAIVAMCVKPDVSTPDTEVSNRHRLPLWIVGGCLAGLAVSLHPVVGAWNLVALAMVGGWSVVSQGRAVVAKSMGFACGAVLCSLPGLIPAIRLIQMKSKHAATADYIQVFGRLKHHLDPMDFSLYSWGMYLILFVIFVGLLKTSRPDVHGRIIRNYVIATLVIAAAGLLIGFGPRPAKEMPYYELRGKLLKFYPFRVFDIALPMAISILLADMAARQRQLFKRWASIVLAICFVVGLVIPFRDRFPHRLGPQRKANWLAACEYIQRELPPDALVLTPTRNFAFKWYAQRAEFVSFKDCPQDADGIVAWNQRLNRVQDWASEHYDDKVYSANDLQVLNSSFGITHVLADHLGPMEDEPIYSNESYRLYRIAD